MLTRAIECPKCGAPLEPDALRGPVVCRFCGSTVLVDVHAVEAAGFAKAFAEMDRDPLTDEGTVVEVSGARYRLEGRLGCGESSDVFLARRARRLSSRVVVKLLRARSDADLVEREWNTLAALQESRAQGAEHFTQLLPEPIGRGAVRGDGNAPRPATVLRYKSGFLHTFDEVMEAHPGGVDARDAVWMWRRVLELLGFVHKSGFLHGALLPQHLLVHPRDHGVTLVGFSCAVRSDQREPLPAIAAKRGDFYPGSLLAGEPPSRASDICMSARCVAFVLGGDPSNGRVPDRVPGPIGELVREHAASPAARSDDCWQLMRQVGEAAREAFGPPAYHAFQMPGWN